MNFLKVVSVLVIGAALSTSSVHAMKLAPFPNSKPLQPIPVNVQPNITNNINSDSGQVPALETNTQGNQDIATLPQEVPAPDSGNSAYIVYAVALLAVAGAIFLKVRSKNEPR